MEFFPNKNFAFLFAATVIFLASVFLVIWVKGGYLITKVNSKDFVYTAALATASATPVANLPKPLANPPAILKTTYMTGWSAGSKKYLDYLYGLFDTTQINSVVVDVKDYSGLVSYATGAPLAKQYGAWQAQIPNIDTLINNFHAKGIYVIGRVVIFEDPTLAKNRPDLAVRDTLKTIDPKQPVAWKDNNGLAWVDPASSEVWDYNIEIAKDALAHGFDEINVDYVRFPTDGNANTMDFPVWDQKIAKRVVIKNFFKKWRDSLPGARISVDIFGQVTTSTDDMGIGQVFEDSLAYFDYVCPMAYPSHYVNGFLGYQNPAEHPYQIIKYAIAAAVDRKKVYDKINALPIADAAQPIITSSAKIRPWLQDFNLGATYNADMVGQEIKAVTDATGQDYIGYMLWNPSNIYTKGAILRSE